MSCSFTDRQRTDGWKFWSVSYKMKFVGNTRISKGGTLLTGSEASPTVEPTGSSLMLALNKIYFIDLFYNDTRTKISTKYTDIKRKGALILQELLQRESLTKQKSISTFFSLALLLLLLLRSTWESPAAGSASVGVLIWLGLALIHLQRELKAHRVGRDLGQEVEQVEVKGNLLKTKDKVQVRATVKSSCSRPRSRSSPHCSRPPPAWSRTTYSPSCWDRSRCKDGGHTFSPPSASHELSIESINDWYLNPLLPLVFLILHCNWMWYGHGVFWASRVQKQPKLKIFTLKLYFLHLPNPPYIKNIRFGR